MGTEEAGAQQDSLPQSSECQGFPHGDTHTRGTLLGFRGVAGSDLVTAHCLYLILVLFVFAVLGTEQRPLH